MSSKMSNLLYCSHLDTLVVDPKKRLQKTHTSMSSEMSSISMLNSTVRVVRKLLVVILPKLVIMLSV